MRFSEGAFLRLGLSIVQANHSGWSVERKTEKFRNFYGMSPMTVSYAWELLCSYELPHPKFLPRHLLWTLNYLKEYNIES